MLLFLVEPASETLRAPVATFVLLLAIVLAIPPIFERFKLPGLIGLIAAGVVFGSSGLGWLDAKHDTMRLFSDIGKIYLMFVAGLEIDLILFQRTRNRSMGYGLMTFAFPFIGGIAVGLYFGFGWLAAVLIGSLLSSHTLLAYPIVQRFGVLDDEAVTVTVGATIFTDIASLIVLAICLGISKGDFSAIKLVTLLGSLGLYAVGVLVGLKRLGKLFFRMVGRDEGNRVLFVLLAVFLSAVVARLIGVEDIIGAFLAGLAINSILGEGPVKDKIEFMGSVLFIPMFFVNMGLLLDLEAFGDILSSVGLPLAVVGALLLTKLIAALSAKQLYGYSSTQMLAMWSLSVPQVAATLAAALVGYQAEIISTEVFNSVILLMLVTAMLGPVVTTQAAKSLALQKGFDETDELDWLPPPSDIPESFSVLIPVYNPENERALIELGSAVAQYANGRVIPLAIALAQPQMDSPQLTRALTRSRLILEEAQSISESFESISEPELRISNNVAQTIAYVGREQNANLIIMGMAKKAQVTRRLFSNIQDEVMQMAHCPVVVARMLEPVSTIKTILIPIENPSVMTLRVLRFAQVLAVANQAQITLLHVCSPRTSEIRRMRLTKQMEVLLDRLPPADCSMQIELLAKDNVVETISKKAKQCDLVVLRSQRRRNGNGLTIGNRTTPLVQRLTGCSLMLVGEPHPQPVRQRTPRRAEQLQLTKGALGIGH
ncbi:MAG: universal stress protein [Phormidesmis sp. RL_2_1]|nr:universal stress protein [Phormidesmis sp. RL_2_1]